MHHTLAQALHLPGPTPGTHTDVPYPNEMSGFASKFGGKHIGDIVYMTLPYIFAAAGIGVLLMFISAGFTFLTAAGDAKKMESGKQRLTNALLGFFLIFAAYWIVQIAGTILGFTPIQETFPGTP